MARGGRRILFEFGFNEKGEMLIECKENYGTCLATVYKQKQAHRPSQAVKELLFALNKLNKIKLPVEYELEKEIKELVGIKA